MKKNLISCTSSDFDYFSEQNTQNMIRDGVMSYVAGDLKTEGQVTITVDDSPHYLDLSKAQLYVKIKVYKYNKDDDSSEVKPALKDSDTVSLCNNTLNSLFSQIDLYINDTKVESKMQYGLQSYIQDLLNYNIEAKNTSLQSQGWYNDTAGEMDNIIFIRDTTKTNQTFNQGLVNRRLILGNGEVEFLGAPHLDLFTNGKYLLNQTKMSLVLTNQSNNYVLIGSGDYKIKILKAGLYIKKLNVNDELQNAVNIRLEKSFANYEIKATKVITKKINTSGKSESIKICDGIIPKTVILAIGDYEGTVVGKLDRNPFNFYHHNLKSINLQENGGSYPYSGPLILDYEKNDYLIAYKT